MIQIMKYLKLEYEKSHSDFANVIEQTFRDVVKAKNLLE